MATTKVLHPSVDHTKSTNFDCLLSVMALDQVVLPKLRSFSLKVADIPKTEERVSSKQVRLDLSQAHDTDHRLFSEVTVLCMVCMEFWPSG